MPEAAASIAARDPGTRGRGHAAKTMVAAMTDAEHVERIQQLDRLYCELAETFATPEAWAEYRREKQRLDEELGMGAKPLATLIPFPKRTEAAS